MDTREQDTQEAGSMAGRGDDSASIDPALENRADAQTADDDEDEEEDDEPEVGTVETDSPNPGA